MVKRIAVFALALVATPVSAHPLHSSFTEITREGTGTIVISIRLFADDFGATLDSLRATAKGLSNDAVAQQYFARSVTLSTSDGKPIPFAWCGMKSERGLTWLCARSAQPVPSGRYRVRNALMYDRFTDQISVMRWLNGSASRTLVLTARSPEAMLN